MQLAVFCSPGPDETERRLAVSRHSLQGRPNWDHRGVPVELLDSSTERSTS